MEFSGYNGVYSSQVEGGLWGLHGEMLWEFLRVRALESKGNWETGE